MAQLEKRDITRVNMNLPTQMVSKVKKYAEELGLPVTQAYTVLLNKALDYDEVLKIMPSFIKTFSDVKDLSDSQNDVLIYDDN